MGAQVNIDFLKMFQDDWLLLSDLTDMVFGAHVGEGNSRSVYEFKISPKLVIKIDKSGRFDNVVEWEIWNNLKHHKKFGKFLCPCVNISSCGRFLIQERTTPMNIEQMPKEIPDFLTDFKIQNWGKLGRRIVCHDYANHTFMNGEKTQMFQPDWWSDRYQVFPKKIQDIVNGMKSIK